LHELGGFANVGAGNEVVMVAISGENGDATSADLAETVVFAEGFRDAVGLGPDQSGITLELSGSLVEVSGAHAFAEKRSLGVDILPGGLDLASSLDQVNGKVNPILVRGKSNHVRSHLVVIEEGEQGQEEAETISFTFSLELGLVVLASISGGMGVDVLGRAIEQDELVDDVSLTGELLLQKDGDFESETGAETVTGNVVWTLWLNLQDVLDVVFSHGLDGVGWHVGRTIETIHWIVQLGG